MKKLIFIFCVFFLTAISSFGQNNKLVNVGDVFTISSVDGNNYKYLKFPKSNFVVKKGGIVNYNKVVGKKVKVTSIKEKNGTKVATLVLVSGKKFFNSHKSIKAVISDAIENKELVSK